MTEDTKVATIAEDVAQKAVNETGFGRFNLKIMAICGLIYMNIGFGYGSLGLVIPASACDFHMTTVDKSRLSIASALGMLMGAYVWGCTADVKGRKFALIVALFLHGIFDGVSAVTSNYWMFVSTKFFSGLGISGQLALLFAYLGEFQPTNFRDRILSWMEAAWVAGYTICPLIGWAIIPLKIEYPVAYLSFHSWNLFMIVCSFPAIVIGICMLFLPETPKYLAESGQYAELLRILENMYSQNNKRPSEEYTEKILKIGDSTLNELVSLAQMGDATTKRTKTSREILSNLWNQTVMLLKPPYRNRTLLVGTAITCLMSTCFPLIMWLPEVFNRFATFETLYPGETANVCSVSSALRHNVTTDLAPDSLKATNSSTVCDMGITDEVFVHTIILGMSCIPTAIWLPLFIERLGYVFHLVCGSFICALTILGLLFVSSSLENLILSCIFESVSSVCVTAILCMLVELYPTNLRVMAAAFSTFIGRIGTFTGNALFGNLIDDYCVPLISVLVGQLCLCGIVSLFIPRTSKKR